MASKVEDFDVDWSIVSLDENGDVFAVPILSVRQEGCLYTREEFCRLLFVSFGHLAKNSDWYMVVKDQATKDRFTLAAMYSLSTGITTIDCSLDNSDWETIQKFILSGPHDEGPYCRKEYWSR